MLELARYHSRGLKPSYCRRLSQLRICCIMWSQSDATKEVRPVYAFLSWEKNLAPMLLLIEPDNVIYPGPNGGFLLFERTGSTKCGG